MLRFQQRAVRQQHGAFNHVFQLAHVPLPNAAQEQLLCLGAHSGHRFLIAAGGYLNKVRHQPGDILQSLAQRGNRDWKHVQAVEQILAEPSRLHF